MRLIRGRCALALHTMRLVVDELSRPLRGIGVIVCAALLMGTGVPFHPHTAHAQTPGTPLDTVPLDTVPRDTTYALRHPSHLMYLTPVFLAAATAVVLVAPPAFLVFGKASSASNAEPRFQRNHLDIHVAGGPAFTTGIKGDLPWAHSASLELLRDGLFAEARLEHYYLPGYLQYESVRVGYLVHRGPVLSGGVTLGYRGAHGVRQESGLEINLPLMAGGAKGWARFETAYVVSRGAASWNFRGQGVWPISRGPYFLGFNLDAKSLPLPLRAEGSIRTSTAAVLVGRRWAYDP